MGLDSLTSLNMNYNRQDFHSVVIISIEGSTPKGRSLGMLRGKISRFAHRGGATGVAGVARATPVLLGLHAATPVFASCNLLFFNHLHLKSVHYVRLLTCSS